MTTKYEMYDSQESAGTLFGKIVLFLDLSWCFSFSILPISGMGLEGVVKGGGGAEVKSLENEVEFSPIKGTCIF